MNKEYCKMQGVKRKIMAFEYAIVLTGGIATGKSTVANIFRNDGFEIIDADKVAHEMLDKYHEKIADLFGQEYVEDGQVLRKKLGALIFSTPEEKLRLEALLHPLIFTEIERQSEILDQNKTPYLVDIPLFFENSRYPIEKSIVVYTPHDVQLQRLIQRDDSDRESALQRIKAQIPIEEKKQKATYVINNEGDLKVLQNECDRVKEKIIKYHRKEL